MDPATILSAPSADQLTIQQLSKERGVSPVTVWRWTMRGVHGLKLPSIKVGQRRLTTRSLFYEWCRAVTAIANGEGPPNETEHPRHDEALQLAEAEADRLLAIRPDLK